MADIKFTPEQLLTQSAEMTALQSEYNALFRQVTNALNQMNNSWSENLSRNFAGKIQSAQKSFGSITNMLANGSSAAKLGAISHSPTSIESFFSTLNGIDHTIGNLFSSQEYATILTDEDKQAIYQKIPQNLRESIKDAQGVDKWLRENYNKLSESDKKTIDDALPKEMKDLKTAYSVSQDVLQGEVKSSTIGKVVSTVTGDKLYGQATTAVLDATFNKKLESFDMQSDEAYLKAGNSLRSGDITGGLLYAMEGMGYQFRKGGYAMVDTGLNLTGSVLEGTKIPVIHGVGSALKNLM